MMSAKTVLAVDTGARAFLEHKKEFEKMGLLTLRVESMRETIFRLSRGEEYRFVVINEDSIPNFMYDLSALCDAARTHIFITSHSYTKTKHTRALRAGADAYVTFGETANEDVDCALAHLDVPPKWIQREAARQSLLVGGEIHLLSVQRTVYAHNKQIELHNKDFAILQYFISNTGRALSYEQILSQIWGRGYTKAGHKLLWNHVYTLRREIEAATGSSEYIRTEKDYGYRFLPPCSA